MISERARGVRRVVETWEKLHVGTTDQCAFRQALRSARSMARDLNERARQHPQVVAMRVREAGLD